MTLDMSFIPDAKLGAWAVSTFTVGQEDSLSQLLSAMKYGRSVPAGTYKRLTRLGEVIMSNTPDELNDHQAFKIRLTGKVLITGLGLGCAVKMALDNPAVTEVRVIEKSEDVISLIKPYFHDPRLTILHGDAFMNLKEVSATTLSGMTSGTLSVVTTCQR